MSKIKLIIVFIFITSLFGKNGFYIPETNAKFFEFIILSSTNIHSGNTYFQNRHSVDFSYPGFYSPIGEINWFYKNSNNNSLHIGIGYPYITIGVSKKLINETYLNTNIGGLGNIHEVGYFWSSIGLSKNNKISSLSNIEYYFDLNFNNGVGAIFYGIPYNRGITIGGNYIKKLNQKIQIVFGIGLTTNQFRQYKTELNEKWKFSKDYNHEIENYEVKYRWKFNIQPLIKFSINYDL